jgi:hypothetical protein
MPRNYFTATNTENYTATELAQLNANVDAILHIWQSTPDSPTYEDDVKNACNLAHNTFPNVPEIL